MSLPSNVHASVVKLNYFELESASAHGGVSVFCPKCDGGVLTLRRDPNKATILPFDRCILCAQQVEWLDFKKMKESFG